jgi:hypothetical protein
LDVTIPLEFTGESGPAQRNFDKLARLALDSGDQSASLRFGVVNVAWPGGSATSTSTSVAHGLGTTPIAVVATLKDGGGAQFSSVAAFSYDADSFNVQLHTDDASSPANTVTSVVAWIAIG